MTELTFLDLLNPAIWPAFIVVTARIVGVLLVAPVWSLPMIPRNTRIAMGIVLSMAMFGVAPPTGLANSPYLPIQIGAELMIGSTIGMVTALFMHGTLLAGEIVSVQMGLSVAAALAPSVGFTGPGVGSLKNMLVVGLYLALGGHLVLIAALAGSFAAIPAGGAFHLVSAQGMVVHLAAGVFVTALKVAAPLMAAMMLGNTLLGILSKAVPQINTLMVAFPITITLGFVTLLGALPLIVLLTREWVASLPGTLASLIDASTLVPGSP